MAQVAGELEIRMFAEIARLRTDMEKATGIVSKAGKSMESSAALATKAFGFLGISIGAVGFVSFIKGSIDAMDKLRDLSKTTNITVENLSGLKLAAQQSGGDLNSVADSINKLSQNMGKDAEKFRALGITAKEPLEAFKQLADIYTKLEDPQQRAAVMAAALGKSWAGAAPLLSEGSARIQEMVDKGARLSGVTKEMTEQADALNDKWAELTGTGGLLTRMVGPMLPLLNSVADGMLNASDQTNKLATSISPLAEILKVLLVLASDVGFIFTTMGKDIARAVENVKLIAKGDFAGSRALGEVFRKDAEAAKLALDAYQAQIMRAGLTGKTAAGATGPVAGADAAASNAARFLDDGKGAKDEASREQAIRDALHKVREDDDKRELAQIQLQNEQKAALEEEARQSRYEGYRLDEERRVEDGQRVIALAQNTFAQQKEIEMQKRAMQMTTWQLGAELLMTFAGQSKAAAIAVIAINKGLAIAQVVQSTSVAVMRAFAELGPIAGAPVAASMKLLGGIQVGLIAATGLMQAANVGGGGAIPGSPANPISTTAGGSTSSFASGQQSTQVSKTEIHVTFTGNVMSREFVERDVAPVLKDLIDNSDVTIIGANSRQAADLLAA